MDLFNRNYQKNRINHFYLANYNYEKNYGGQMYHKEMACRTRPRIIPQTQIFSYGRSIFVCHIWPKHFRLLWFMPTLDVSSPWEEAWLRKQRWSRKKPKLMARLRQFFGTALQNRLQLIWEKLSRWASLINLFWNFPTAFIWLTYLLALF